MYTHNAKLIYIACTLIWLLPVQSIFQNFAQEGANTLAAKFQVVDKYKSKGVNPILKIGNAITKGMGPKGAPLVSLKCIHN